MTARDARPLVTESWLRSAAAGVDVGLTEAPVTLPADQLRDYRAAHPLARALPVLEDVLGEAARASDALMAVSDEHGQMLWVCGTSQTLRRAERIGFVEGSSWDERAVGTNAPGTALALDQPIEVIGAEHFREAVQQWSCAAVPIHDLRSGSLLGILDITGGDQVAVPQTMAMLRAAARLAELEIVQQHDHARLRTASGVGVSSARVEVACLGRDAAVLHRDGRRNVLSGRHSELLVLLAEAPDGLSGDEIACALYESGTADSTVRAELIRLRRVLAEDLAVAALPGGRRYRGRLGSCRDAPGLRRCARRAACLSRAAAAAVGAPGGGPGPRAGAPGGGQLGEREWPGRSAVDLDPQPVGRR